MPKAVSARSIHQASEVLTWLDQNQSPESPSFIHISSKGWWSITTKRRSAASSSEVAASIQAMAQYALNHPDKTSFMDLHNLAQRRASLAATSERKQGCIRAFFIGHRQPDLEEALRTLIGARAYSFGWHNASLMSHFESWSNRITQLSSPRSRDGEAELLDVLQEMKNRLQHCIEARSKIQRDEPDLYQKILAAEQGCGMDFDRVPLLIAAFKQLFGSDLSVLSRLRDLNSTVLSDESLSKELVEVEKAYKDTVEKLCDPISRENPTEKVARLALKVDRCAARRSALNDLARLKEYGALRFSRKDPHGPYLTRSHYAVLTQDGIDIVRYVHREDTRSKGCLRLASTEAQLYGLLDKTGTVSYLRRKTNRPEFGRSAEKAAEALHGLHPQLLCGARVANKPMELVIRKLDSDLNIWEDCQGKLSYVLPILHQLAHALRALHGIDWIHRDIKPENVVAKHLTREVGLIDFGFATHVDEGDALDHMGSVHYAAPELMRDTEIKGPEAGKALDVYSLGMTGWSLLFKRNFDIRGRVYRSQYQRRELDYGDLEAAGLPNQAESIASFGTLGGLLHAMIHPDPYKRPKIQEVCDTLDSLLPV